jgi:hypothetical protein
MPTFDTQSGANAFRGELRKWTAIRVSVLIVPVAAVVCNGAAAQQSQPTSPDKPPAASPDQSAPANTTESLQKATQNPVANLISVPLQNNTNFGIGPYDRTEGILNIQPVIPVKLNDRWNLMTRIIQPIVWEPYPNKTTGGELRSGRHESNVLSVAG